MNGFWISISRLIVDSKNIKRIKSIEKKSRGNLEIKFNNSLATKLDFGSSKAKSNFNTKKLLKILAAPTKAAKNPKSFGE